MGESPPASETSGSLPSLEAGPIRTCVGCRRSDLRSVLVRVVAATGTATLVLDRRGGAPGRGAWLHPSSVCLDRALTRNAFSRALHMQGADASQVEAELLAAIREQ